MTLNDLLLVNESERLQLLVPVTPRINAIVYVDITDSAELSDATRLYGDYIVKMLEATPTQSLRVELHVPMPGKVVNTPCLTD